jgi:hypothetical protein
MIAAGGKRVLVTIPLEVKDWLQARAIYNGGTQSAEIVRSVRERMERIWPIGSNRPLPRCGRWSLPISAIRGRSPT